MKALLPASALNHPSKGLAWSTFDPLEESIDSDDPLGFGAAVLHLAEQLVPGLSVTTTRLRYYAMLSGGVHLIAEHAPQADEQRRRELFLRWEKLWALPQPDARGLLGIQGVRRYADQVGGGAAWLDHRYRMLSNQAFGGVLGAYKPSCEALGLLERGELQLTDLGAEIAGAFWRTITHRGKARRACWRSVRGQREQPAPDYTVAGLRRAVATLGLEHTSKDEAALLAKVIIDHDVRRATLDMARPGLATTPIDLHGLRAIARHKPTSDLEDACHASAVAALALDGFICQANFVLDRLVDAASDRSLTVEQFVAEEPGWQRTQKRVARAARHAAGMLHSPAVLADAGRWCGLIAQLTDAALVHALIDRHLAVMRTRRARRWLVLDAGKVLAERYPQGVTAPERIRHSYRLGPLASLAREAGRL